MGRGRWEEGNSLGKGRKPGKPGRGRKENRIISIHVERTALSLGALEFEAKSAGIQEP